MRCWPRSGSRRGCCCQRRVEPGCSTWCWLPWERSASRCSLRSSTTRGSTRVGVAKVFGWCRCSSSVPPFMCCGDGWRSTLGRRRRSQLGCWRRREIIDFSSRCISLGCPTWCWRLPISQVARCVALRTLGDYSYGLYIAAYPVQQTVADRLPSIGVPGMIAVAGAMTLALSAASWHLVERPILARVSGGRGQRQGAPNDGADTG